MLMGCFFFAPSSRGALDAVIGKRLTPAVILDGAHHITLRTPVLLNKVPLIRANINRKGIIVAFLIAKRR